MEDSQRKLRFLNCYEPNSATFNSSIDVDELKAVINLDV